MQPHEFKSWIAFLLLAVAVIIVFHLVSQVEYIFGWVVQFFSIVSPFIAGFVIAYILNVPREKIEGLLERYAKGLILRRKKLFSALLVYILLISALWILSILLFPRIGQSIVDFTNFIYNLNVQELIHNLDNVLPFDLSSLVDDFDWQNLINSIIDFVNPELLANFFGTIMGFFGFIFRFALAVVSSIYFMVEGEKVKLFAKRIARALMPKKAHEPFVKYAREINLYFKRYITCQVLDALILGTIMTIALNVIGASYAFALGPMLGFANLIPYFGSIIGTLIAFVVILIADGTTLGIIAGVVMLVIQQVDANFIFPRLIGSSMKVSPLLIIIGITVGMAYAGIIGMIVAIPIVTVLRNIVDDLMVYIEHKKAQKHERREV